MSVQRHQSPNTEDAHLTNARVVLIETLTDLRVANNISQTEVARRMGTTQSVVSDIERGHINSRLSTLQRYAEAIGCRLDIKVVVYENTNTNTNTNITAIKARRDKTHKEVGQSLGDRLTGPHHPNGWYADR